MSGSPRAWLQGREGGREGPVAEPRAAQLPARRPKALRCTSIQVLELDSGNSVRRACGSLPARLLPPPPPRGLHACENEGMRSAMNDCFGCDFRLALNRLQPQSWSDPRHPGLQPPSPARALTDTHARAARTLAMFDAAVPRPEHASPARRRGLLHRAALPAERRQSEGRGCFCPLCGPVAPGATADRPPSAVRRPHSAPPPPRRLLDPAGLPGRTCPRSAPTP